MNNLIAKHQDVSLIGKGSGCQRETFGNQEGRGGLRPHGRAVPVPLNQDLKTDHLTFTGAGLTQQFGASCAGQPNIHLCYTSGESGHTPDSLGCHMMDNPTLTGSLFLSSTVTSAGLRVIFTDKQ